LATPVAGFGTDSRGFFGVWQTVAYQKFGGSKRSFLSDLTIGKSEILDRLPANCALLQELSDFRSAEVLPLKHYKSMKPISDVAIFQMGARFMFITTPHRRAASTKIFEKRHRRNWICAKPPENAFPSSGETLDILSEGVAVFASGRTSATVNRLRLHLAFG